MNSGNVCVRSCVCVCAHRYFLYKRLLSCVSGVCWQMEGAYAVTVYKDDIC